WQEILETYKEDVGGSSPSAPTRQGFRCSLIAREDATAYLARSAVITDALSEHRDAGFELGGVKPGSAM
ncbi:MAG: hypothetical protein ACO39Q_08200, partial [Ilumatobacteraceae bacterium]